MERALTGEKKKKHRKEYCPILFVYWMFNNSSELVREKPWAFVGSIAKTHSGSEGPSVHGLNETETVMGHWGPATFLQVAFAELC